MKARFFFLFLYEDYSTLLSLFVKFHYGFIYRARITWLLTVGLDCEVQQQIAYCIPVGYQGRRETKGSLKTSIHWLGHVRQLGAQILAPAMPLEYAEHVRGA